jgi:hypothetical protein
MKKSILWIALALVALIPLVMMKVGDDYAASNKHKRAAKAGGGANQPAHVTQYSTSRPKEAEAERRLRMVSNQTNRADFKLSEQEIYLYLQANGSNAVSLITAFESSRDQEFLRAAAKNFPDSPLVQAKILMHDALPDERAKWIDAFKKSDPTNSLGNFFAAREAMKRGDITAALAEIAATRGKGYNEYLRESVQGLEDAYLAAGRTISEAKTLAVADLTLPHLIQMKETGTAFMNLAEQTADPKTQQAYLMANWQIGQNLRTSPSQTPLITELVGIAMQNSTLGKWPAGTQFGNQPPTEILDANKNLRREIQKAAPIFDKWFPTAPEDEVVNYFERTKANGERDAMLWLREQHPELAKYGVPPQ